MKVSIEVAENELRYEGPWSGRTVADGVKGAYWGAGSREEAICVIASNSVEPLRRMLLTKEPERTLESCHDEALRLLEEAKREALKPPEHQAVRHLREGGHVINPDSNWCWHPHEAEWLAEQGAEYLDSLILLVEKP